MTSASNQQITRCPKCGTAFRITQAQLQSAKGAVRCGSCLHVFKAMDYLVAAAANKPRNNPAVTAPSPTATKAPAVSPDKPTAHPKPSQPTPQKPVVRTLDKSSLENGDDILISDDMDDAKSDTKSYEFDGFLDIDSTPLSGVSLFERKVRNQDDDKENQDKTDESWAEMLIEDDDEDTPVFAAQRTSIPETPDKSPAHTAISPVAAEEKKSSPGLVFSLVDEAEASPATPADETGHEKTTDEFILSDELANIPDHTGFNSAPATPDSSPLDPSIFETPDNTASEEDSPKRQVKTQPKIRAYDGSRTALLMNIIPAPIEFTAKRMRRWYQRKLWPALSLLAIIALVVQLAWFKFDYFSRVEPYRTAYVFLCPYLNCQVPALVDTRQISAFNLVVREHKETAGALAVDVMIVNNAPFDQPYPDLELVFTDIDENRVASRRFSPGEYLGGEAAGSSYMPQKQPVYITLDLVDPGEAAVNYRINILRQQQK